MQRYNFKPLQPPSSLGFNVVVCMDAADSDVMSQKGAMQRLSSAEPVFAVLLSVAEAVQEVEAGTADQSVLLQWRQVMLTATFAFEVIPSGEPRYWRAQNLRQGLIEVGLVAQLSVRQWIYDVVGFKVAKEKEFQKAVSATTLAKLYNDNVRWAGSSESLSDSFVDQAITVYRRVLSLPDARACLEWAEENMLTTYPWRNMKALHAIVERCTTSVKIVWAVQGVTDLFRMGLLEVAKLTGSKLRDCRESYLEVLNVKHAIKMEIVEQWLPSAGFDMDKMTRMQESGVHHSYPYP